MRNKNTKTRLLALLLALTMVLPGNALFALASEPEETTEGSDSIAIEYKNLEFEIHWENMEESMRPDLEAIITILEDGEKLADSLAEKTGETDGTATYEIPDMPVTREDGITEIAYSISANNYGIFELSPTDTGIAFVRSASNDQILKSTQNITVTMPTFKVGGRFTHDEKIPIDYIRENITIENGAGEPYSSFYVETAEDNFTLHGLCKRDANGEPAVYTLTFPEVEGFESPAGITVAEDNEAMEVSYRKIIEETKTPAILRNTRDIKETSQIVPKFSSTIYGNNTGAITYTVEIWEEGEPGNYVPYVGEYVVNENEDTPLECESGRISVVSDSTIHFTGAIDGKLRITAPDTSYIEFFESKSNEIGKIDEEEMTFDFKYSTVIPFTPFKKYWNDNKGTADSGGIRPANAKDKDAIAFELSFTEPPSSVAEVVDKEPDIVYGLTDWTLTYSDLAEYTSQGEKINYTLTESKVPDGYIAGYPTEGANAIVNTRLTDLNITKKWNDKYDDASMRPSVEELKAFFIDSGLTLMEGLAPNKEESEVVLQADNPEDFGYLEIKIIEGAGNEWSISIKNLPEFNEDNLSIHYSLEEGNFPLGKDGYSYKPAYKNAGNYSADTASVYNNGTLSNTLDEKVSFTGMKKWADYNVDPENRPTGRLTLYRYPNLEGYDYEKATIVVGVSPVTVPSEDNGFSFLDLPRFDEDGNEYIYYVKETLGSSNEKYEQDITNVPPYSEIKDNKKFIFDGGTVKNKITGTTSIDITKTWIAAAIQSFDASSTIRILGKPENEDSDEKYEVLNTFTISGFKSEMMSQNQTVSVNKYNEEGVPYVYKVEEVSVKFGSGDPIDVSSGSFKGTIGGKDYKFVVQCEKDAEDENKWQIDNVLDGHTNVYVTKIWNHKDNVFDESTELTYYLFRDGKSYNGDEVTNPVTADSDTNWSASFNNLPRYDATGREYNYTIKEENVSGYHTAYSYSDSIDEETLDKEREVTITNTFVEEGNSYVTVKKEWKDDDDQELRHPVLVAVYRRNEDAPTGEIISRGYLTKENDWEIELSLGLPLNNEEKNPDNLGYDDFIVKEVGIAKEDGQDGIWYVGNPENAGEKTIDTRFDGIAGYVRTDEQYYKVTEVPSDDFRSYTVTNQRVGTLSVDLTKKWIDGTSENRREVTFELYKESVEGESSLPYRKVIINGDGSIKAVYDEYGEVELEDYDKVVTYEKTDDNNWKINFINLEKYDQEGVVIEYTSKEIYDTSGTDYTISFSNTGYTVGDFHTNDKKSYSATNSLSRTLPGFTINKVWMDVDSERTAARPDVYFQMYRTYKQLKDGVVREVEEPFYIERDWTITNNHFWMIKTNSLPKYTNQGYEYSYYAVEYSAVGNHDYDTHYYEDAPTEDDIDDLVYDLDE